MSSLAVFASRRQNITLPPGPTDVPAFKVPVEMWANKSTYTGGPIVPEHLQEKLPEFRYTATTSPISSTPNCARRRDNGRDSLQPVASGTALAANCAALREVIIDVGESSGAARGIRTPDPLITNEVLYQLSYRGEFRLPE